MRHLILFLILATTCSLLSTGLAAESPPSLGDLLDASGQVELPEGFSGTIDPSGYQMVSEAGQAPRSVGARGSNAQWSEGEFSVPGCSGTVNALLVLGNELFVGGAFEQFGLANASLIARMDLTTGEFYALGDGLQSPGFGNDDVFSLAAIVTDLYVDGTFQQAGGTPALNVAVYDTTQSGNAGWSALGDGVDSPNPFGAQVVGMTAIGSVLYAKNGVRS